MSDHLEKLQPVLEQVVAEHALRVDKEAAFPVEAIAALGQAGLLGLISSADVGGMGHSPRAAVEVIERIARHCGTTAMVVTMHYCAAAVIEAYGSEQARKKAASGELSTLAFSEAGSRSHFWAPLGSAKRVDKGIELNAHKSWVTSANHAHTYVWSSQPVEAQGASTIWLVDRSTPGVSASGGFDGLGLRGNDSAPCKAEAAVVPADAMLGDDGTGFAVMMEVVLPLFSVLNSACSLGLMEAVVERSAAHVSGTRYEHLGSALCELPTIRSYIAQMRCKTDMARTLLFDTLTAMESTRPDTMLRVLQAKAVCNEAATQVTELGMRICGGAAFRKDVGVERYFRDARAGTIMAPTTDVLYDFIGKAVCGMDLF